MKLNILFAIVSAAAMLTGAQAQEVHVLPSGDPSGVTDHANIRAALLAAKNGGTVLLAEGTFYLHESIVVFDFDGTFKGAGTTLSTVRTAPGVDFDVSASLDAIEGFPPARGLFASMFLFPYNPSDEAKIFNMSDLTIVVDQPAVDPPLNGYVDDRRAYLMNTMSAFIAVNADFFNFISGESFVMINLDAAVQDVVVEGIQDPRFRGFFDEFPYDTNNSLFDGIGIWGPNAGNAETINVRVLNADFALNLSDNNETLYESCDLQNAVLGIEHWDTPTTVSDNVILNANIPILLLFSPDSLIKGNSISADGSLPIGAETSASLEIRDNFVTGNWLYGINPFSGSDGCTITGNVLGESKDGQQLGISSLFGAISVEESNECTVSGNKFVNVSSPSLGAVWVSGQFNRVENNDYTESGLPGWNVGPGAVMLARFNGATFNRGSRKNYVFETQYPAATNVCDQVQGLQGNNVQALIDDVVVGINPGMCSAVLSLEVFNQSHAGLLQQMAEMQDRRGEGWSRSKRPQ